MSEKILVVYISLVIFLLFSTLFSLLISTELAMMFLGCLCITILIGLIVDGVTRKNTRGV